MGRPAISEAEKEDRVQFGACLRRARTDLSLSLHQAAKSSGIERSRLSRIESGERPTKLVDEMALARVYGIPWIALSMKSPRKQAPFAELFEGRENRPTRDEYFGANVTREEKDELEAYLAFLKVRDMFSGSTPGIDHRRSRPRPRSGK